MYKLIIKLRSRLLVYLTHNMALPILRLVRKPNKFPYSSEQLKGLPEGILGRDLINMLNEKGLALLPYYAKHDIKHLLLQYDTTDEGEVCLQCFMLGNTHISFPVIATVIFGFVTMPEHWSKFKIAYKRGSKIKPIEGWPWFSLLNQPTKSLVNVIGNYAKN